jgi:hypothetical protein
VSWKSPEIVVDSTKGLVPLFFTRTAWVVLEVPVTVTGVLKLTVVVDTLRLGSVELPVTLAGGRVVPVSITLMPSSSDSSAASWLGELAGVYITFIWQTLCGCS